MDGSYAPGGELFPVPPFCNGNPQFCCFGRKSGLLSGRPRRREAPLVQQTAAEAVEAAVARMRMRLGRCIGEGCGQERFVDCGREGWRGWRNGWMEAMEGVYEGSGQWWGERCGKKIDFGFSWW